MKKHERARQRNVRERGLSPCAASTGVTPFEVRRQEPLLVPQRTRLQTGFTLIEILVVIGIIAILAAIVIIAINPARQFAQARNSQRTSNVNVILNGVGQSIADNKGVLPAQITTTAQNVANTGADLCAVLVPTYLPSLLVDPLQDADGAGALAQGEAVPAASCGGTYDTAYTIVKDVSNRVTVCAPNGVEPAIPGSAPICVTR